MSLDNPFLKEIKSIQRLAGKIRLSANIDDHKSATHLKSNKLFKAKTPLDDIAKELTKLDYLKNFQSFHIAIHERGNLYSENFSYSKNLGARKSKIKVREFNLLFSTVSKSKSNLFEAKNIKTKNFPLVGYFLANAYKTYNLQIIIMISEDSFLKPDEDSSFFENELSEIIPQLSQFYTQKKQALRNSLLEKFIYNSPIPMAVYNNHQEVLFDHKQDVSDYLQKISFDEGSLHLVGNSLEDSSDFFHEQRLQLLGELLNTLRHELNNPLFGLKLASQILHSYASDNESTEFIDHVATSSNRCTNIIENFSKFYSQDSKFQESSIKSLVEEVLILTKSETKTLKTDFINESEIETINANPTWIIQILFNFLINSTQSILNKDEGKILISITRNHNHIEFNVEDNGSGIPQELQDKLLQPFFTTKQEGTGIGLSISRHLAQKMNGHIHFKSEGADQGSTFTLSLPIKQ